MRITGTRLERRRARLAGLENHVGFSTVWTQMEAAQPEGQDPRWGRAGLTARTSGGEGTAGWPGRIPGRASLTARKDPCEGTGQDSGTRARILARVGGISDSRLCMALGRKLLDHV
jgi:hypothetical protein